MVVQNEALSLLFASVPASFQILIIMLVVGCQKFDMKFRSKLINKMMGQQDEAGMVLLSVNVGVLYSIFISVRLVGAELATVCCSVFIGFVSHFIMTYHIIKDFRKVTIDGIESENREKKLRITKLIITELIEGFTPIIYGICIAMAYYGPNAYLFSNIGNTYWSVKMNDIGSVIQTMSILFFVDTFSVIFNSILLWKILHVNMFHEFCRVLTNHWFLIALPLELAMSLYFAMDDVNLGMDDSHSYKWVLEEGRQKMINNSMTLNQDENKGYMENSTLI